MRLAVPTFVLAALMAAPVFAQNHNTINSRRENQQDRIAQGVNSGQLTPGETARLEKREKRVNREVRRDRRTDDGRLTRREKAKISRQQNRLSKSIYRDKHNGRRG